MHPAMRRPGAPSQGVFPFFANSYGVFQAVERKAPAILFDLDGTLIDSAPDIVAILNRVLGEQGVEPVAYDKARVMIGRGARVLLERAYTAQGVHHDGLDAALARFLALYRDEESLQLTRLYPGALELLQGLKQAGHPMALVTNKPIGPTRTALSHFGLTEFFGAIYGGDVQEERKPAPFMLQAALKDLDRTAADAIMLGDTDNDVMAAKSAGVKVIGVSFGYSVRPIAELEPDHIVDALDQVPAAISFLLAA